MTSASTSLTRVRAVTIRFSRSEQQGWLCLPRESEGDARQAGMHSAVSKKYLVVLDHFCLDLPHESEGGDHQVQLAEKKGCLCLPRESEGDARQAGMHSAVSKKYLVVLDHFCLDLPHESEGGDHQVQLAEKKGCLCLPRESEGDARQAGVRYSDGMAIVLVDNYAGLMPCLSRVDEAGSSRV